MNWMISSAEYAPGGGGWWSAPLIRYQALGANPAISEVSAGDLDMARKGKSTEEIIGFLREAEVRIAQGETAGKICRGAGISEQSYYKWRREYGGLKIDQAKRLKELERENERLKKAVSELTLDKLILKEALSGKY
jgi:putative transposase